MVDRSDGLLANMRTVEIYEFGDGRGVQLVFETDGFGEKTSLSRIIFSHERPVMAVQGDVVGSSAIGLTHGELRQVLDMIEYELGRKKEETR